jgi:glutamate synthase (NADPH/NADH) small chain
MTKRFVGEAGRVTKIQGVEVRFGAPDASGRIPTIEQPGSEWELPADLVLLAMGFLHPVRTGLLDAIGVERDARGNIKAAEGRFATGEPGIFAAGDCRRGQSLVVWALWEGREAARAIDIYLSGRSRLQSRNGTF